MHQIWGQTDYSIDFADKEGEGFKRSQNSVDVIYGCPQKPQTDGRGRQRTDKKSLPRRLFTYRIIHCIICMDKTGACPFIMLLLEKRPGRGNNRERIDENSETP